MKRYVTLLEIKWGLIFTFVTLVWMIFEKYIGWHDVYIDQHAILTNVFILFAIAIYIFALLDKRKHHYQGFMTWKEGFLSGLVISFVIAIMSPFIQVIIHAWISPDYFPNAIYYGINKLGKPPEEMQAYFNLQSYMWQSTLGALIIGTIISAVVAIFVKKNRPAFGKQPI